MNGILQGGYRSDCGVRKKREREREKNTRTMISFVLCFLDNERAISFFLFFLFDQSLISCSA